MYVFNLINYNPVLMIGFFVIYITLASLFLIKYSKKKIIILVTFVVIYILIMMIPFQVCHSKEHPSESYLIDKDCTCIGIGKFDSTRFAGWAPTECVGIIKDYKTTCYEFVPHEWLGHTGYYKEIPCK